jgi:hypothetical protein
VEESQHQRNEAFTTLFDTLQCQTGWREPERGPTTSDNARWASNKVQGVKQSKGAGRTRLTGELGSVAIHPRDNYCRKYSKNAPDNPRTRNQSMGGGEAGTFLKPTLILSPWGRGPQYPPINLMNGGSTATHAHESRTQMLVCQQSTHTVVPKGIHHHHPTPCCQGGLQEKRNILQK